MGCNQSASLGIESFDYKILGDHANLPPLTQDDMAAIKTSWNIVKDLTEFGITTMIRTFDGHKEIKNIWIFASNLETEAEMRSNSQLKYHADKIMNTIARIIKDIDPELSKHKDDLISLGTKHFHYGVQCEYFKFFQDALLNTLEMSIENKEIFNAKTKNAWIKFFLLTVDYMCTGIKQEAKTVK